MNIGVTTSSFDQSGGGLVELLESKGFKVRLNPYRRKLSENESLDFCSNLDGLIAGVEPLTRKVIESSNNLKVISRVGIGLNNVDVIAAKESGVVVFNTPDAPTQAVSEMTLGMAILLLRKVTTLNKEMHLGYWNKIIGRSLSGLNILIVGLGRIGQASAKLFKSMGACIYYYDPYNDDSFEGYRRVSLEEGLKVSELISMHASGDDVILGREEFRFIKKGSILLNPSRGSLVDENCLIDSLERASISGAWLDTFWQEPYKGKLQDFDQVILTPHCATYSKECRLKMESQAVKNLLKGLDCG